MPPKVRITKEEIVNTAVELVRLHGEEAINARTIAAAMNCSTQPVFSNFATMEELREAVILASYERYLGFIKSEVESEKYPTYKAFGMAYVRFASQERELFKLLFMRDRSSEDISPPVDFEQSVQIIMEANGVSHRVAQLIHLEMWTCVHGIGVMLVTSFLQLDMEIVSDMLSDIYHGLRARHITEGDK